MSIYKTYDSDQLEELSSNFLIESWSYSKVSEFARNEKAFEMSSIYGYRSKSSASTVAGNAYHEALCHYFENLKTGNILDIVDLQQIAYDYIENLAAYKWKLQKTTPTVQDCQNKAISTVNLLLSNFLKEVSVYLDDVSEILDVEIYCDEWVTVNGVDIPLPCHAKIDLVVKLKNGSIAVIDHKSKAAFSDQEELQLTIGRQAITYVIAYEAKTGLKVNEVWFVENKYSQNRDKSPQLNAFKLVLDKDVRAFYESLLYEPLKRMISAVSDPDYVYLINDQDNFIDKAEIYMFWTKTMIAEIDEFNVPESKRELIAKRMKKIRDASIVNVNPKIIKNFRSNASEFIKYDLSDKDMTEKEKIEHTLHSFGIIVEVSKTYDGYSSNTYLLSVSAGVKISAIHSHRLDIANALNVSSVRISKELVVDEGKSYVAIEFAKKRDKDLIFDPKYLSGMKIPIGIDNYGNTVVWDLTNHSTPHVLVCGATGCLAGDTDISVYMPHYKRHSKVKTIENLYNIKNGNPSSQTRLENKGKKDILVRCLDEKTNEFTYSEFDVVYSGMKQCFKVKTNTGHHLECTADHRLLTPNGWFKLSELKIGDSIYYRPAVRNKTGKQKQLYIKDITVKFHPSRPFKMVTDKKSGNQYKYFRVPFHHMVYEAEKNNMSFDEYRKLLNNYDEREIFFVPKKYQVDHIDGDRSNNDISNLQMLSIEDHSVKTIETAKGVFGHFRPAECVIVSVEPTSIKDTYDICCNSSNHNFLANGLVVHNSGKSVSIRSTIEFAKLAGITDIVVLDPKYEFLYLNGVPGVKVYNEILDIENEMLGLVEDMNNRVKSGSMKWTLVIFDEFADAVSAARSGRELMVYENEVVGVNSKGQKTIKKVHTSTLKSLEENLKILLQKGRSSGFRVLAATQRASVKVITGDAKVNFPVQICFRVPKAVDSKVVLDEEGAESLGGMGDGLMKSPEYADMVRFQAFFKP